MPSLNVLFLFFCYFGLTKSPLIYWRCISVVSNPFSLAPHRYYLYVPYVYIHVYLTGLLSLSRILMFPARALLLQSCRFQFISNEWRLNLHPVYADVSDYEHIVSLSPSVQLLLCSFHDVFKASENKMKGPELPWELLKKSWWVKPLFFFFFLLQIKEFWRVRKIFPKVGLSSDLYCCMRVLHFRSVALAFSFLRLRLFPPRTKSHTNFFFFLLPIPATSFFSLYNSGFSMVDLWRAILGSLLAPTCTTVIQLW